MPELKGKLDGYSMRVPTPDVSVVDFVAILKTATTSEAVNAALKAASAGPLKGILGYTEDPVVSSDMLHNPNTREENLIRAIELAYQTTGLGTWGSRERLAPTVKVVEAVREDLDDLDERELGRLAMEAIRKTRNTDPERRKR